MKRKRPRKPQGVHLVLQDGTVIDAGPDTVVTLRMYGPGGGGGRLLPKNGFKLRPGEPDSLAWLGAAPYIEAKAFPFVQFDGLVAVGLGNYTFLMEALRAARKLEAGEYCVHAWRRVLLPMLLEEAKRRGIET